MVKADNHLGYSTDQTLRQCLLDESRQIALDLACPICENSIVSTVSTINGSPQPQIITRYHNEGGIQTNLDILPLVTEEAYLEPNPAARPARAFMTMCGEGDVAGITELLKALGEDADGGDLSPGELLRWQDPLDGMKTGLHVAIERGQQEAVWLLLWLASGLQTQSFPGEVARAAEAMGSARETANGADIRGFRDEQERTAADVAESMGNMWAGLLMAGVLQV